MTKQNELETRQERRDRLAAAELAAANIKRVTSPSELDKRTGGVVYTGKKDTYKFAAYEPVTMRLIGHSVFAESAAEMVNKQRKKQVCVDGRIVGIAEHALFCGRGAYNAVLYDDNGNEKHLGEYRGKSKARKAVQAIAQGLPMPLECQAAGI